MSKLLASAPSRASIASPVKPFAFKSPVWLFGVDPRQGLMQSLGFLGSTISLLLVFRTNTAYSRFWEGRKIWETMHSKTRDIASLTDAYSEEFGRRRCRKMGALLGAFPVALQLHLQGVRSDLDPESEVRKLFRALGGGARKATAGGYVSTIVKGPWGLGAWKADVGSSSSSSSSSSSGSGSSGKKKKNKKKKIDYDELIPYENFVAALENDNDKLAAKIDLPTDLTVDMALDQLHMLKYGTRRNEGEGVSLEELSAY